MCTMIAFKYQIGLLFLSIISNGQASPVDKTRPKVILVSMDGFRHDYLSKTEKTPNFDAMLSSGVSMPYMNNTFVTLTFPSHTSIVTGMYEESHGIVGNRMYDPVFDAYFSFSTTESRWWDGAEPLWATAKKAGLKVGVYFWPGSTVPYKGILPNEHRDYNGSVTFEDRTRTLVKWMAQDDFDLGLLYFDEPDHTGHYFGPDSPEVITQIERMDRILGLLVSELTQSGIMDNVNLIVTSDHGMASVDTNTRLIDVLDYVNDTLLLEIVQSGPASNLIPQPGKATELVDALKNVPHMQVMLKEEIPEEKFYKKHRRVPSVFALAEDGWEIAANATKRRRYSFLGNHGFDNDQLTMKPFFIAKGPAFKIGEMVEPIKNVDIYPLICHLLDITPSPNNGSLHRAKTLLKEDENSGGSNLAETNKFWKFALPLTTLLLFIMKY